MENASISLTSDMWTSINVDAYIAITCHYIDDSYRLNTVLLDVEKFPNRHSAENMALVKTNVMMEWTIKDKVKCLVTDAAANMIACARILQVIQFALHMHLTPWLKSLLIRYQLCVTF